MNTANISSNLGTGAGVASREGTGRKRKAKKIFDNSTESMLVKKSSGPSKKTRLAKGSGKENNQPNTVSVAKDSPFKKLAGSVYGGQGHAAIGVFTPSGNLDLFSPGTIESLQGSPKPTTSSMVRTVGIAFSTSNKLNLDEFSDSETSVASGSTDPISTSSSESDLFELSDSGDEGSRDSFSSQGASEVLSETRDFPDYASDLRGLGFDFSEVV